MFAARMKLNDARNTAVEVSGSDTSFNISLNAPFLPICTSALESGSRADGTVWPGAI